MSDEPSLEKRAAQARRDYWQGQYEAAVAAADNEAASAALRFVQEYDAFLALVSAKSDYDTFLNAAGPKRHGEP